MAASWHMPYFKVATTTTGNSLLDILCLAGFNKVEMAFYDFFPGSLTDIWPHRNTNLANLQFLCPVSSLGERGPTR